METDLMHGCATRHAQAPLPQPLYSFAHVPKARSDLAGSKLHTITHREHFHEAMGEMVLLCKEAMRRRRRRQPTVVHTAGDTTVTTTTTSLPDTCGSAKPLSLEYLADRLDIDDPCFGYLVRTSIDLNAAATATVAVEDDDDDNNSNPTERTPTAPNNTTTTNNDTTWKKGMLQGFITVTTFTNWQHSFRWDSLHSAAYEYDTLELEGRPERVRDVDGSLAQALQSTVHCGDILNEGIVWPRIAEISLLGGIGSGKALVQMVLEKLESFPPTPTQNYDYVVLQATENSIPFYESLGFCRVGAIMLGGDAGRKESVIQSFIRSDYITYEVPKSGETLTKIATKFGVDVLDLIFLNPHILQNAKPSSKPLVKTVLLIPKKQQQQQPHNKKNNTTTPAAAVATTSSSKTSAVSLDDVKWHVAKENETPRGIAHLYGVKISSLVQANRGRFPDLLANSRLRAGTRLKVSHFNVLETEYKAYAHWSFPDKLFDDPEPSYMMARKLQRRAPNQRHHLPFQASLRAELCDYEKPELLLPPSPQRFVSAAASASVPPSSIANTSGTKRKTTIVAAASTTKRRPLTPYMAFALDVRGKTGNLDAREIRQLWNDLSPIDKTHFEEMARESRDHRQQQQQGDETVDAPSTAAANHLLSTSEKAQWVLYNKVVRLRPDAITEHSEYTYWYVLTFIPDLKWCHLAPMYQDGVFGPDKPRVAGQPRWRLVNEELGQEVDISSSYCIPIRSRSMRKTLDADKEEWHIIDDGKDDPTTHLPITPRVLSQRNNRLEDHHDHSPVRKSLIPPIQESPSLLALMPESSCITTVTIVGQALFKDDDDDDDEPVGNSHGPGKPPAKNVPRAAYATEPRPRHHARKRPTVQFDIPASARKAAALRTVAGMNLKQAMVDNSEDATTRRKSAPSNVGGTITSAELLGTSTQKRGRVKRKLHDPSIDDSSNIIFEEDGSDTIAAPDCDTGRTMEDEKVDYFAPRTLSSRLRTKGSSTSTSSEPILGDQPLQPAKKATLKINILPVLQKTADATEYFEPVVFESRLRHRSSSGLCPVRAAVQRSVPTAAAKKKSSGTDGSIPTGSDQGLDTDYFTPVIVDSRLRRKHHHHSDSSVMPPSQTIQPSNDDRDTSQTGTVDQLVYSDDSDQSRDSFVPMSDEVRRKISDRGKGKEHHMESVSFEASSRDTSGDYFAPVILKSRLRHNHPDPSRAAASNAPETNTGSKSVQSSTDYFAPVIIQSRLRHRSQREESTADHERDEVSTKQNRAIDSDSAKDSLPSPIKHDQFGVDNQFTRSSPRRIFSSTSANSGTPSKTSAKRMAAAAATSSSSHAGLTTNSHQTKRRRYG